MVWRNERYCEHVGHHGCRRNSGVCWVHELLLKSAPLLATRPMNMPMRTYHQASKSISTAHSASNIQRLLIWHVVNTAKFLTTARRDDRPNTQHNVASSRPAPVAINIAVTCPPQVLRAVSYKFNCHNHADARVIRMFKCLLLAK